MLKLQNFFGLLFLKYRLHLIRSKHIKKKKNLENTKELVKKFERKYIESINKTIEIFEQEYLRKLEQKLKIVKRQEYFSGKDILKREYYYELFQLQLNIYFLILLLLFLEFNK